MSDDDDCDLPGCLDDAMMDVPEAMMDGLKTAEKAAIAVGGKTRDQLPPPPPPLAQPTTRRMSHKCFLVSLRRVTSLHDDASHI